MFAQIMFYSLAALTVILAFLVVSARNAVHSAIFLIGTLMCIAGIFIGLGAEFVAGVQILTYVGGIMVLFLFVIMLINVKEQERTRQTARQWWLAIPIGIALAVIFTFFYYKGLNISPVAVQPSSLPVAGNTEQIGWGLYMQYLLPFEIASVLLLVAIIGAVVLAAKRQG